MSENDLQELLNLMRRMYCAAQQGQWDAVNELDSKRNRIFAAIQGEAATASRATRAAVSEIIELDHAVLDLANLGMAQIAAQTTPR